MARLTNLKHLCSRLLRVILQLGFVRIQKLRRKTIVILKTLLVLVNSNSCSLTLLTLFFFTNLVMYFLPDHLLQRIFMPCFNQILYDVSWLLLWWSFIPWPWGYRQELWLKLSSLVLRAFIFVPLITYSECVIFLDILLAWIFWVKFIQVLIKSVWGRPLNDLLSNVIEVWLLKSRFESVGLKLCSPIANLYIGQL